MSFVVVDFYPEEESLTYQLCRFLTEEGDSIKLMKCVIDQLEASQGLVDAKVKSFLMIFTGSFIFFMQGGFAMLCAGCVRKKNTHNTMLKNLLDACAAGVVYFCCGFALAFGGESTAAATTHTTTFMGTQDFFGMGKNVDLAFYFFHFNYATVAVTIVAGALAERCQMAAYLLYSCFMTGLVYPISVHAVWSVAGFLSYSNPNPLFGTGMLDFAGSAVIHITGGTTAIISTYLLGSRRGRFYHVHTGKPLLKPKAMPGHSVALQVLGAFILLFGWFGFNAGTSLLLPDNNPFRAQIASMCAINTFLSAGTAAMASLLVRLVKSKLQHGQALFYLRPAINGALTGLVSITASCATLDFWAAIVVGTVAGIIYPFASDFLLWIRIDDVVDAIPVHLVGGIWGALSVGLFSEPTRTWKVTGIGNPSSGASAGLVYGGGNLLACQIVGILCIILWTTITMGPLFFVLHRLDWFRSEPMNEIVGLDTDMTDRKLEHEDEDDDDVRGDYAHAYDEFRSKQKRKRVQLLESRNNAILSTLQEEEVPLSTAMATSSMSMSSSNRRQREDTRSVASAQSGDSVWV
ncbi:Ammonium transporter 1 member [Seminavis robusta]|uniref:Ammonium transporter n=1 Tax=Seminavis robusta TaxID=568900 RepID=A0A9N8E8H1_9STRA|nr:Ammonium transporter 1 member [Seminavis robusta]|eukprot:Sro662_g183310.1 Ammonium transporter 1 member (576) ;mRNA; r:8675-10497